MHLQSHSLAELRPYGFNRLLLLQDVKKEQGRRVGSLKRVAWSFCDYFLRQILAAVSEATRVKITEVMRALRQDGLPRVRYKKRIVRRLAKARAKKRERQDKGKGWRTLRLKTNPQSRALGDLVIEGVGPQEVPVEFMYVSQETAKSFRLFDETELAGHAKA